ncbi:uncharacterized protein LOC142785126 [Rhipicephalus microplus]|uniref:uncharacterized protein LOC142785126 n=1 Tax=Rhipicephalus microplus TaxID=6941 RepID=UPI003F6B27AF
MATTWKRSVSESSIASIAKVPVALLWCQLFRPRISRCGCILLVLGAMGVVTAVTISKSLVACSSIFSAETVLPKGAIHQADWGPETRYVTTASVPAVRPTRPVADHVGAQRAKQAFDRRRSRKVAVAERVRLAAEHEPENVKPTAVKERGVPGGGQDYSVSHRLAGADSRRDDSSDNSPEASSASDSEESTTVSEETETDETQTTTDLLNAPPTRTVDGVPATPESANISDASSTVTEFEANKTSAKREKSSQSLTETHVHKRGVTVMSPKLSSVTHSSKQTKPWPRIMIKVDVVLPQKKPTSTSVHISTNATSSAAMTGLKTSSSSHIDASKSPPVKASAKQWSSSSVEPYSIPKINPASSAKVTQRTASYYTTAKTSRLPPIESSGKETLPSGEPSHASSVQATVKITSNYSNTYMSRSTITEMSSERRVVTRETATDTDVTSTHSTNTTGQTTSYHGVVNTSQSHGATASWNGITASVGSSSASYVLPEMKSTGTNKTKAAHPIDMSHEITTTPNNVSWPTETFNVTISDWTATWTKSDEEKHSSTRQHGDILCNTTFCAAEGKPKK